MKLSKRFALLTLIVASTVSSTITAPISATNHKPTLAQIEAAKKAEEEAVEAAKKAEEEAAEAAKKAEEEAA